MKKFGIVVRNSVLHETGLVLLKGLDLDSFSVDDVERMKRCSKVACYLFCSQIGTRWINSWKAIRCQAYKRQCNGLKDRQCFIQCV